MRKRWFSRILPATLVAGLALALLAPAQAASPAYLGVAVGAVPEDAAQPGAMVHQVTPDSPAARAGLKKGDVITKIDDKEVKGPDAVVEAVKGHRAGDKVKVQVLRDGKEQTFDVALGERRAALPVPEFFARKGPAFLGVWTQELTAERKKELGVTVEKGAVVADIIPGSPAAKAGLKKDDVIVAVGDQVVSGPEELRAAVRKTEIGKEAALKVARGGETKEVKVTLQPGPLGFGWPRDLEKDFPMLKDGRLPFEKFPGLDKEFERVFEELQKRIREMEQKKKDTDRSF